MTEPMGSVPGSPVCGANHPPTVHVQPAGGVADAPAHRHPHGVDRRDGHGFTSPKATPDRDESASMVLRPDPVFAGSGVL